MSTAMSPASPQGLQHRGEMLVVTSDVIPGYHIIEVLGLVRGNTVRARNFGRDFLASMKSIVGGEVRTYTTMLSQSREQALDRLRAEALELGGNAVVALRITTSTVMQGAAEILAYGTAVRIEREPKRPSAIALRSVDLGEARD